MDTKSAVRKSTSIFSGGVFIWALVLSTWTLDGSQPKESPAEGFDGDWDHHPKAELGGVGERDSPSHNNSMGSTVECCMCFPALLSQLLCPSTLSQ